MQNDKNIYTLQTGEWIRMMRLHFTGTSNHDLNKGIFIIKWVMHSKTKNWSWTILPHLETSAFMRTLIWMVSLLLSDAASRNFSRSLLSTALSFFLIRLFLSKGFVILFFPVKLHILHQKTPFCQHKSLSPSHRQFLLSSVLSLFQTEERFNASSRLAELAGIIVFALCDMPILLMKQPRPLSPLDYHAIEWRWGLSGHCWDMSSVQELGLTSSTVIKGNTHNVCISRTSLKAHGPLTIWHVVTRL